MASSSTMAWTKFGSGFSTSDTVTIAARTKKLPVNHHVPLNYYLATADSLLKQGQVYRDQGSVIDCYVLLLRFASLVCETIPDHRHYRLYETEIKKYRQKLDDVTSELEKLKPQVEEQVRHHNKAADKNAKHPKRQLTLRKGRECGICAERRPTSAFISTKDCVHEYCTECCRHHAEVRVMSGSARVDCPHPDCAHAFHISQCHALLSAPNFDILSTRLTEAAIPAAHKVFCPFQDCSFLMERYEDEQEEGGGPFAVCFACHRGFCLECKVPWHGSDRTCAEYRAQAANAKQGGDEKLRELAKENKWQACPDCAVVVELKSGCYHITCRCGTEFCYLCQKKWEKKKPTCKCKLWDERNIIDHRQRVF